jgi:hypothetical protein
MERGDAVRARVLGIVAEPPEYAWLGRLPAAVVLAVIPQPGYEQDEARRDAIAGAQHRGSGSPDLAAEGRASSLRRA